ncbi:glycerate kinase [Vibrio sp. Makdt]|uniref:glycerate kinase type-2 family protein n=1 Tax=Vibrio sp. Makdt TaxID=2998828 RepID=UPI0022CD3109|nr:glycerate kinase [Vibrio sp. Makdt]MDA0150780.1 glycerate kinase [Vibrio sp. Makdt]
MDIDAKQFLQTLFSSAVNQALPKNHIDPFLPQDIFYRSANQAGRTVVIGAGKAAASMAAELEAVWQAKKQQDLALRDLEGLVVTRYEHLAPCEYIEVIEAAHPVPDAIGLEVSHRMLELVSNLSEDDTVICLLSGGGSALLSLPGGDISLAEKQQINKALLKSGAAIDEMNCVRKHLSSIKGGRLAKAAYPARVVSLAISDVPGDDISVIASGPTVPDTTTRFDALAILERYQIEIPGSAFEWLNNPQSETVKPDDICWKNAEHHIIATPMSALESAAAEAEGLGIPAYVLSDCIEGEAREVAKVHAALAKQVANNKHPFETPCVLLSGGETTVTVKGNGRGGRNCEFLLSLYNELKGQDNIFALAADTDGIDGVEDNAGAWITPETWQEGTRLTLKADDYLEANNSYDFFKQTGVLLTTGPTLTNVNDFRAILIL